MSPATIFKITVILLLISILLSLLSGLIFLVKDKSNSKRTLYSLTTRITLSVLLFLFLIIGYQAEWIQPHGLTPAQIKTEKLPQ